LLIADRRRKYIINIISFVYNKGAIAYFHRRVVKTPLSLTLTPLTSGKPIWDRVADASLTARSWLEALSARFVKVKTRFHIILLSTGLGLVAWIIDAVLDALVFYDGTFMDLLILHVPPHELYIRLIILAVFITFGLLISGLLAQRASVEHALHESQRAFETLMGNLPGMAYRCLNDEHWTMKFVSEGAAALTGYRPADLIDNRSVAYADLIVPEDQAAVVDAVQAGVRSGKPYQIAYRITAAGGQQKWVWEQGEAVRSADGDGLTLEGFITDITERKKLEEALRESEERSRTALYSIGDAVITTNNQGTIRQMNPVAEALTGWSEAEAAGKLLPEVFKIINEKTRDAVDNPVVRVLGEGVTIGLANHTLLISRNGTEYPIADSGAPIRNAQGEITGVVLVFRDQTEERAAEQALRESEQKYRSLFENMLSGFAYHRIVLDEDGQPIDYIFLDVNSAFEQQTGLKRENIIGRRVTKVIPGIEQEDWIERYGQVALTGQPLRFEQYSEALEHWFLVSAYSPQPEHFVTVFHDITERKKAEEALRASEERYRVFSENAPLGIWQINPEGYTLYANPAMCSMLQVESYEELWDVHVSAFVSDEDYRKGQREVRKRGGGVVSEYVIELNGQEGRKRMVHITGAPIFTPDGELHSSMGLVTDITERLQTEEALQTSERRYRALAENAPTGLWQLDPEGCTIYANPAMCELAQVDSPQDLVGVHFSEFFSEESLRKVQGELARRREGIASRYEVELTGRKGRKRQVLISGAPILSSDGELRSSLGLIIDITERVQAEEALQASERRYRALAENAPVGIWQLSPEGHAVYANPAMFSLLQIESLEELPDEPFSAFLSGEDLQAVLQEHARRKDGVSSKYEVEMVGRRGQKRNVLISGAPILSSDGELQSTIGLAVDITERVQAEEALRESEARLAAFTDAMPDVGFILDGDGKYLEVVGGQKDLLADRAARLRGHSMHDVLPQDVVDKCLAAIRRSLATGEVQSVEYSLDVSAGHRQFEGRILSMGTDIVGTDTVVFVARDITERVQAEEALRKSEVRLAAFTSAMPDVGFILDGDGMYLEVLGAPDELLAADAPRLKGSRVSEILPREAADKSLMAIRQALATGEVQSVEYSLDVPAGHRWFEARTFPMDRDVLGPDTVVFVARDITERTRMQEAERQQRLLAEALRDTAAMLHSTLELDEVLERILKATEELVPHRGANVMLFDGASGEPRIAKHCACYEAYGLTVPVAPSASVITDLPPFSEILRTRQPVIASDVREHPNWPVDVPSIQWIRAYLGAPILVNGEVAGLINLDSDEVDQYTPDDAEVLAALANQAAVAIDSARLYEQARQQRLLAEALRDTAAALHSTLELDEVLDRILEAAEELVPHGGANIILIDKTSGVLKLAKYCSCYKVNGLTEPQMPEGDLTTLSIYRDIVQTHEPLIIPDTHAHPGWPTDNPSIQWVRSYLCVPIIVDGEVAGYINLDGTEADAFVPDDAEALVALASQAAVAISSARLYEDAQRRANELEALRRITINITTQFDLDALLADLMRSVQELLEVNAAGLYLHRPEKDVLEWVIGLGQTKMKVGSILRRGEGLSGKVWETGEPLTVQDYANWEGKADHYDIRSRATILGVPIHWGDETLGVINAGRYGDASYSFSDRDIRLLSLFADQAAIAIRNAQLFDQVEERARYLSALNRASSRVSRWGLDLDGVLQAVVTTLAEEIGIDFARIWLADKEDESLELRASDGWREQPGVDGMDDMASDRTGRLTQIAQEGKPYLTNWVQEDEAFDREWAAKYGIVSFAGYPLKKDRRLMAVLTIFHSQPLAKTVLDVMGSFANQAAIAIENARLYEELETYSGILEQAVAERTADLERAKEQVESILHHSPDGIVLLKPDGAVETANLAALKMLGYGVDDLVGEPASMLVAPSDANRCQNVLKNTRQQRIAQRAELLARRSDGTTFDAQAVLGPIVENGDVIGIVCSLRDITALKEVERIKDDFLATAAHELRTPLTSIRGFSELLLTRDLSRERQERYHHHINDQSTQLANIIDDLLDISRLEAGRGLDLKLAPVHMNALIEEVVDPFAETMSDRAFRLDLQEDRPVKGDAFRLSQVVRNLVLNAVKYSPEGGKITIKSRARGDMLDVSVADQGIGITEKQQNHLFEKFYRADPSSTSGTGLGLVICKLIVEGHGGEIRVESRPDEGSTFTFTLPFAE
jgi:PAS domain S-box-containing protein